ncbi:MAG: transcriptional regulator [Anaerolineaceae bacterium]|nr:transcriptional regulator [Anaerolineaceae bacterium]
MNIHSHKYEKIFESDEGFPLGDENALQLAELFTSLSDPSRLRILSVLLRGEKNVQQISQIVVMSHSAVSHQLRGLRQMRIVRTRKQGRMVFYSLDDDHVKELFLLGLDHVCHE